MRIVADENIPFLKGVLEPYAEVFYLPGEGISRNNLIDADALIVRTRTLCNEQLLLGTKVQFIGSATIGTDHIDTEWCDEAGIRWTNAPGCNADSVEQYVTAALLRWMQQHRRNPADLTIGIVGVGNVGSRVAKSCQHLGMQVLLNDPPRERREGGTAFTPLLEMAESADILSFHVPLTLEGTDKTRHLVNSQLIAQLQEGTLLINTCRGEVFDTQDILSGIKSGPLLPPIIDCWEGEPIIDRSLLEHAYLGTPHIAGYSQEGKANGTAQVIKALAEQFDWPLKNWSVPDIPDPDIPLIRINGQNQSALDVLRAAILHTYPIEEDDNILRFRTTNFEELRSQYQIRREYPAFTADTSQLSEEQVDMLKKYNFKLTK